MPRPGLKLATLILCSGVAWAGWASTANAKVMWHTVEKGESLPAIALRYYGEAWQQVYIATINELSAQKSVDTGSRLRIPDVILYRVQPGDTWSKVAKENLGDSRFASMLLWANNLPDKTPLASQDSIIIPFLIRHTARVGDNLTALAQRYYHVLPGDPLITRLGQWNQLSTHKSITEGLPVFLPIRRGIQTSAFAKNPPKLRQAKLEKKAPPAVTPTPTATPAPVAKATPQPTPMATPVPTQAPAVVNSSRANDPGSMQLVQTLIQEGAYQRALFLLQDMPLAEMDQPIHLREYYWNLTVCQVAMGNRRTAIQAMRQYLDILTQAGQPLPKADDPMLSPKMRQVLARALKTPSTPAKP